MLFLLNSTKTMNLEAADLPGLEMTEPRQMDQARFLANKVSGMSSTRLADLMSLSPKLTAQTFENAAQWGRSGRARVPAIFGFTGLVYKHLDAAALNETQLNDAQQKVRILSGLYGVLRPLDQIEAYRLEMGLKMKAGMAQTITAFWKESLTDLLNEDLKTGEIIINLAAQEYVKALDFKKLKGTVITPVFKEKREDGTYRTVAVHAKKARGEFLRYALVNNARNPKDLLGFSALGWKAAQDPPREGHWLFTRPVGS